MKEREMKRQKNIAGWNGPHRPRQRWESFVRKPKLLNLTIPILSPSAPLLKPLSAAACFRLHPFRATHRLYLRPRDTRRLVCWPNRMVSGAGDGKLLRFLEETNHAARARQNLLCACHLGYRSDGRRTGASTIVRRAGEGAYRRAHLQRSEPERAPH